MSCLVRLPLFSFNGTTNLPVHLGRYGLFHGTISLAGKEQQQTNQPNDQAGD